MSEDAGQGRPLEAVRVGADGELVTIPVDQQLTVWLNNLDEPADSDPPTPRSDAWHAFTPPLDNDSVIFEPDRPMSFDVLEILSYPEGLDSNGVPLGVVVHPLCGPQADVSCADAAWGETGVKIPTEKIKLAIADTQFYAIGGILLPDGDSHPDSFMALIQKDAP